MLTCTHTTYIHTRACTYSLWAVSYKLFPPWGPGGCSPFVPVHKSPKAVRSFTSAATPRGPFGPDFTVHSWWSVQPSEGSGCRSSRGLVWCLLVCVSCVCVCVCPTCSEDISTSPLQNYNCLIVQVMMQQARVCVCVRVSNMLWGRLHCKFTKCLILRVTMQQTLI